MHISSIYDSVVAFLAGDGASYTSNGHSLSF
jgi:hypothetical protein